MKHKEIEGLIQKRLDREITRDEEVFLFKHLEGCPDCQKYYLEMEGIKNGIAGLIEFLPRMDFNKQVLAKIGIKRQKVWQRLVPVFIGLYLASLIILILLFSSLVNYLSSKMLLSIPFVLHTFDKIRSVGNGIMLLTSSFLKLSLPQIFIGFLLCLLTFYAFIRIVNLNQKNHSHARA